MKTILITGANGFIAGMLAARWKAGGLRVLGTSRKPALVDGFDAVYPCALGESLAAVLADERVDAVVHAANYAGAHEYQINVDGTTRWLEEARSRSVATQVFLSSLSAALGEASAYARAKRDLEARFVAAQGVVVRLGLVIGAGGFFARMVASVRRMPLLPVLDGGSAPVYVVSPRFLTDFVDDAARVARPDLRGGVWHIHQPAAYTLREILHSIRAHTGASCRFVPVPSLPVLWALAMAERIPGLRLPVNATNVRGLRAAGRQRVPSDLERLGGTPEPLDALVAAAVREADAA